MWPPNKRINLAGRGGGCSRYKSILSSTATARSLCAGRSMHSEAHKWSAEVN